MRKPERPRGIGRRLSLAALAATALVLLAGCAGNGDASTGWLPQGADGGQVTNQTGRVTTLWVGTWIAALAVGLIVWGLTIFVMVRFRRRSGDTGLPPQLRYNVPIEMLYTIAPVFMVAVLFVYTANDQSSILDTSIKPDVTINVVSKQWSWDFNYVDADVYESGVQVELDRATGNPLNQEPVLYLPQGKRVEFVLTARDVIHSFWVPAFLQKMDMLPGVVNRFQLIPEQTGEFQGKCAELCGAYHSQMLFKVKVVSQADFDAEMTRLKDAGQTGQLPNTLNREPIESKQDSNLPSSVSGN